MGRSIKKGPFVAPELIKRVVEMNEKGEKKVLKTWSRASTIFGICYRGHGWSQAGRVCSHPYLQGSRGQQDLQ